MIDQNTLLAVGIIAVALVCAGFVCGVLATVALLCVLLVYSADVDSQKYIQK